MPYSAKAIANAFLQTAEAHGAKISPLKLQKLVYISHGWHLALKGEPLVNNELPEAWQYGPVFPSLYREFREFGRSDITKRATDIEISDDLDFEYVEPCVPEADKYTWAVVQRVWDQYGKYGGIALSDLTHRAGSPWDTVRKSTSGVQNADIPNDIIRAHYGELREKGQPKASAAS